VAYFVNEYLECVWNGVLGCDDAKRKELAYEVRILLKVFEGVASCSIDADFSGLEAFDVTHVAILAQNLWPVK